MLRTCKSIILRARNTSLRGLNEIIRGIEHSMTDGEPFHVIIQRFLVNNNFDVMCKSCFRICLRNTVFRMLEFCWIFTRSYLFIELGSFFLSLIHSNNIFFNRVINVENTRMINKPVLYFLRFETVNFFPCFFDVCVCKRSWWNRGFSKPGLRGYPRFISGFNWKQKRGRAASSFGSLLESFCLKLVI